MVQHNTVSHAPPIALGNNREAACPQPLTDGRLAAQGSITNGRGSASTDRVMRLTPDFPTDQQATHDVIARGLNRLRDTTRARRPTDTSNTGVPTWQRKN